MAQQPQPNLDRDWSFEVDLVGVPAPTGQSNIEIPEGFYEVKILDTYINKDKNANRVIFKIEVAKGPYAGTVRTDGLGIPNGKDDKVRYYWRARAESAGYTTEQLDSGAVTLKPSIFKDRSAFIKYVPPGEDSEYQTIVWLAPAEWTRQKAMVEGTATEEAPAAKPNPLEAGAPTTQSRSSLLDRLKQASA